MLDQYLRSSLNTTLVVLRVDPLVQAWDGVEDGVPHEEGGIVDSYRAYHLDHEPRQSRGRLGQLSSWEDDVQRLARRTMRKSKRDSMSKLGFVSRWKTGTEGMGWLLASPASREGASEFSVLFSPAGMDIRTMGGSDKPM